MKSNTILSSLRAGLKIQCWVEQATGLFRWATSPPGFSAASCRRKRAGSPFRPFFRQALTLCCGLWFAASASAADKIPALAKIPVKLPAEDQAALTQKKAELEKQFKKFENASNLFNAKSATDQSDDDFKSLQEQRKDYIEAVRVFNQSVAFRVHQTEVRRVIQGIKALARKLNWSAAEQARLDAALNNLGSDSDPAATNVQIRQVWKDVLARDGDGELAREASTGAGPGFPGAGTQSHQDCTIFALANATGSPYSVVAALAGDLIRRSDWHDDADRADPEKVITQRGLNGGEVIMLAETLGQATIVSSSDFAKTLKKGHRILVNVIPQSADLDSGHEIVISKTFKHGAETWFSIMESNQSPDKHLYLSSKELNTILQEKGVMFQPDPHRTPALLREKKD